MPENARTPSKFAQIAPIQSANHTPRRDLENASKLDQKPGALASEEKFPTLEVLAEEKGIEIEQPAEASPANGSAKQASSPAAWQGKLPEAVKQDGEFTKAEINFIDEPAERAAKAEKEKEEKAKLAKEKEAKRQAAKDEPSAFGRVLGFFSRIGKSISDSAQSLLRSNKGAEDDKKPAEDDKKPAEGDKKPSEGEKKPE